MEIINRFLHRHRETLLYCVAPLLLLALLGLSIFRDFGSAVDEDRAISMLFANLRVITSQYLGGNFSTPYTFTIDNVFHYGTFFNLLALPFQWLVADGNYYGIASIEIKHGVTFLFSLLAYASLGALLWKITGSRFSMWIAVGCLALQPFFFGFSFSSPKDIPFASAFTFSTLILGLYVTKIARGVLTERTLPPWEKEWRWLLGCGAAVGITTSIRIGGVVIPVHALAALTLILLLDPARSWKNPSVLKGLALRGAVIAIAAFAVIWIMHPAAWPNPFAWLWDTINYLSHHPRRVRSLLNGAIVVSDDLPWYYLPVMFYAQTPLLWLLLAAAGLFLVLRDWRQMELTARVLVIMILLQGFSIPLAATIAKSSMYSGFRQFTFFVPAFAFLLAYALIRLWPRTGQMRRYLYVGALSAYACTVAVDLHGMHPYEYSYYNELAREGANGRWSIDNHVSVSKEAARWLNREAPPDSAVIVNYDDWMMRRYARPDMLVAFRAEKAKDRKVLYGVAAAGGAGFLNAYPGCEIVHFIDKQLIGETIRIANIRRCR